MNHIDNRTLNNANTEAIYNVYSYIANKIPNPKSGDRFEDIINSADSTDKSNWSQSDLEQLQVLKNAIKNNSDLANSRLVEDKSGGIGLNASIFEREDGEISVVFCGTGSGEWIDNGEGLSGVLEENIYKTYDSQGNCIATKTELGYATEQQMEALNWFNQKASEYGWDENTNIIVTGHSKGGNKAQFITANSDLVDVCYSYDGQGFSPEALAFFKEKYGYDYEKRRQKIFSFSADNDYVNVLGERMIPEDHIYFFEAPIGQRDIMGYHHMHAMLDENGNFNGQTEQGDISIYIQGMSEEIMALDPDVRKYITLGLMNIAQEGLGGSKTVNGDFVSDVDTKIGLVLSVPSLIINFLGSPDGWRTYDDIGTTLLNLADTYLDNLGAEKGKFAQITATIITTALIRAAAPFVVAKGLEIIFVATFATTVVKLGEKLRDLSVEIYSKVSGFISSTVSTLSNWANRNLNYGYQYASANTIIRLNTYSLRDYAERLKKVNNKLVSLDNRLDRLCTRASSADDLFLLIRANCMLGYSWKIWRCVNYLNNTASDFENAERTISSRL